MPSRDPRIDAYIAARAEFAHPLLTRLREWVHEACPGVEESMKWSMPAFLFNGSLLCTMAAFKRHASFGFWKHAQVLGEGVERDGMGSYGRMASLKDLPPKKTLVAHIRKAVALNAPGAKAPPPRGTVAAKPPPQAPADLLSALKRNRKAQAAFDGFAPSHRREYIEWVVGAKRDETRQRRIGQAVEWLAEGKRRNWKYERP